LIRRAEVAPGLRLWSRENGDERIVEILGAQPPDGSSVLREEVLRGWLSITMLLTSGFIAG
jgi:hypothetical protein